MIVHYRYVIWMKMKKMIKKINLAIKAGIFIIPSTSNATQTSSKTCFRAKITCPNKIGTLTNKQSKKA